MPLPSMIVIYRFIGNLLNRSVLPNSKGHSIRSEHQATHSLRPYDGKHRAICFDGFDPPMIQLQQKTKFGHQG